MTEFDRIVMAFLALLVVVLSLMVTSQRTRVRMVESKAEAMEVMLETLTSQISNE